MMQFRASSPRGLGELLARELRALGATEVREHSTGVSFCGTVETAYRACLWSRTANRVFLELARFQALDADEFYSAARHIDWSMHVAPGSTLACDFTGQHPALVHTHFAALKLKDAICDELRARAGYRPDISTERPSVRVHAHAHGAAITVALDLSGESLHRRGYRGEAGAAPLKENLAAGILLRAGWPQLAAGGAEFLDPMCGSGTLVIEAAMIAADIAPGLIRTYFGFLGWRQHDRDLWAKLLAEANLRSRARDPKGILIRGQDKDAAAVRSAGANANHAGVGGLVQFAHAVLAEAAPMRPIGPTAAGLLCSNPPYGVRLTDRAATRNISRELGDILRERFLGWQAAVLVADPQSGLELGIRAHRTHVIWNGAIECRLLRLHIDSQSIRSGTRRGAGAEVDASLRNSAGAQMFANRLAKNLKRLRAWADAAQVSCFRVYDADMPEYSFAIDLYQTLPDGLAWLYVQEYAAPTTVDAQAARRRRGEALSVLTEVCGVPPERIRVRLRRRTPRGEQYGKLDEQSTFHVVAESGLKFRVNFDNYLDTGLFLDHRLMRGRLRAAAGGKRFLNLFAYTGAATVYAAAARAHSSTSVDLSRTYLEWARRNLAVNGLEGLGHVQVHADCREWLAAARQKRERFDLVFLDPPTFSNSKRMQSVLDIRRDHAALADACVPIMARDGLLVFSTNARRFKLDETLHERFTVLDVSAQTLPVDFERNPKIHRCFELRPS
ncbi:MAG TPA: bifunctional 23S rRNA (guanine(2069)-N(7))-methyltransferase RlmK/23S rRNA (guanine(2445)-N(2))-methyltransferase RlmL [Steroidobacteraceae bacterium]|jgi:23S rRNA (guanine2445-N2)-methyltransferase / 23S rRNA (guanine2069-N7)-methyltransferase|nr:bifunctional 23S rRNA (guanine(2069)-N(7))-methyltransferase RlmK/23S rRNA (guanine(2445)-N(2))-methyltransferase RlmL [Steroidobacteraceae bacterium]